MENWLQCPNPENPILCFPACSPQQPSKVKEEEVITISEQRNRLPGKLHQFTILIR